MAIDPGVPNVGEVRAAHVLNAAALNAWMAGHVEGYRGPLSIQQFKAGASNPTYMLTAASGRYVLRKKPPGQLLASAHQVDREYRVMRALGAAGFTVPHMRALCDDEAIIG